MKTTIYTSIFLIISFLSFSQQKNPTNSSSFKSVTIGEQVWMSENLNVSTFRNGDLIPQSKSKEDLFKHYRDKTPTWCYYDFDEKNGSVFGKLYNLQALTDIRGLAPEGWKIPSNNDWELLFNQLGGLSDAAKKIKSSEGWMQSSYSYGCKNCIDWSDEYKNKVACHVCKDTRIGGYTKVSNNGSNSSGFNALPSGYFNNSINKFRGKEWKAVFWHKPNEFLITKTTEVWNRNGEVNILGVPNLELQIEKYPSDDNSSLYSVRCIKNLNFEKEQKLYSRVQSSLDALDIPNAKSKIDSISDVNDRNEFKGILSKKIVLEIDRLIKENKLEQSVNLIKQYQTIKGWDNNRVNDWNRSLTPLIKEQEFQQMISTIKNNGLSSEESKLIGDWDFRSKNIKTGDGGKSYLVDVIRFNKDRTFYFLLQEHDARDDSKLHKLEKTGYWKFENNKLTFYVDFETDDKQKTRVNKTETINFSELADNEAAKTLEIGSLKIEMRGKKRL
jgi:uncharacterized protein (TIGR02145 family)